MRNVTVATALAAVRDMLAAQTGDQVILARPDDTLAAIYVWPWFVQEDPRLRQSSAPANSPGGIALTPASASVQLLVLVWPALTSDGLTRLDAARQAILDHPILHVAGRNVQPVMNSLSAADLAAIFVAASLPLTICLSATVRGI